MRHSHRAAVFGLLIVSLSAAFAKADEVILSNGDRLSGKVTYDGTKLVIDTASEGKVSVELKNVKTITSTGPVDLVLSSGRKLHGKIDPGPDGQIIVTPDIGLAETLPLVAFKAINPAPVEWVGNVILGGVLARGNTDSDTFNASAEFTRRGEHDQIDLFGQYLFARQRVPGDGKHETTNDLTGRAKYDYFFTPKFYGYASVEAEHDPIAGIAVRLAPSVGVGYQWVETPRFNFNTEAGVGYLYRKYSHDGEDGTPNARLAYHLKVKFTDKLSGFNDFEYLPGFVSINNYFFDTQAGVRAAFTEQFFAEFKVDYRYDSRPAPGKGHSDTRYILGVGWAF